MAQISFAIFSEQRECAEAFARLIESSPHAQVAELVSDPAELRDAIRRSGADAVLADLGHAPHVAIDLLEGAVPKRTPLLVCGPQDDSQIILRALKLGAREFFSMSPTADELDAAIDKLLLEPAEAPASHGGAKILAIMGAKGGVGATFVACQLAASLQRTSGPTALVDLNCPLGDAALYLDLHPQYTFASIQRQREDFDATYLHSVLTRHGSGLQVLAAPDRVEEGNRVSGPVVERSLAMLHEDLAWIVVDVARGWDEASMRALELADQIVLVTSLDVASLDHTRKHVDLLKRLGHGEERIRLVANRQTGSDSVTPKDFESFMGRGYEFALPNDYQHAAEALNTGRTLEEICPGTPLTEAFRALAVASHEWCGSEKPEVDASQPLSKRIRKIFRRK